ncbi:hypothetical protein NDU88_004622 [Pleurodeles waltl]|uniref:Uncharacterized protein n=1 Tax=Pleurodeles waltl TaxID=8319 RepID=A0AAV7M803_PLEWA|nr:hypothetical protein NDU88_004622 [Pleurodeles waltl]
MKQVGLSHCSPLRPEMSDRLGARLEPRFMFSADGRAVLHLFCISSHGVTKVGMGPQRVLGMARPRH